MIILAADTDAKDLHALTDVLYRVFPDHAVVSFRDPLMAFPFAMHNHVDMAFLGLRMSRANGNETAAVLRRFNPHVYVCAIGYSAGDESLAMRQGFTAFAQKPVTQGGILRAINGSDGFARRIRADD